MTDLPPDLALGTRTGLPEALLVLARDYPRDLWASHRNFDGLTRFWLQRHMMFRDLHRRLVGLSRDYLDNRVEARAMVRQTVHLGGMFLRELDGHHRIEDHHYFPQMAGLEPRIERGFALLDADHHHLEAALADLAGRMERMLQALTADRPSGTRDAAGAVETGLAALGGLLDRHLEDEEDLVVPVILHHAPRI